MKKLFKTILSLILCASISVCVAPVKIFAEENIRGHNENQHYENTFFGIQVDLPEEWRLMSDEELNIVSAGMGNYFFDFYAQNTKNGNTVNIMIASVPVEESDQFTEKGLAESNCVTLEASLKGNPSIKYPSVEKTTCIFAGKEHAAIRSEYAMVMQQEGFGRGGNVSMLASDEIVYIISGQHFAMVTASTSGSDPKTILDLFVAKTSTDVDGQLIDNHARFATYLKKHPEYKYGAWIDLNKDGVDEILLSTQKNNDIIINEAVLCALSSDKTKIISWSIYSNILPITIYRKENAIGINGGSNGTGEEHCIITLSTSGDMLTIRHIGKNKPSDRQETYYYDYTEELKGGEDIPVLFSYGESSPGKPDWNILNNYAISSVNYGHLRHERSLDTIVFSELQRDGK